jgi:hypothetical protein
VSSNPVASRVIDRNIDRNAAWAVLLSHWSGCETHGGDGDDVRLSEVNSKVVLNM